MKNWKYSCIVIATICICQCFGLNNHNSSWIANYPSSFSVFQAIHRGELVPEPPGKLNDIRGHESDLAPFREITETQLWRTDGFTDGEVVDALEHFFWGQKNGIAMELGALDGSPHTRSMTYEYEKSLGWKRILIDANPIYRHLMAERSPLAFGAIAAICEFHQKVHFRSAEYVGGIIEFMGTNFMKDYHHDIYDAGIPPGNVSSINWDNFKDKKVSEVDCMPLNHILQKIHVQHVNFFILDVEGGELEVLKSIHWNTVSFDVMCIETEPNNRPEGFSDSIRHFLASKGYHNATGQVGRNTWFVRKDFTPFLRSGLSPDCFNGAKKSIQADQWYLNRRTPPFKRCPLSEGSYQ